MEINLEKLDSSIAQTSTIDDTPGTCQISVLMALYGGDCPQLFDQCMKSIEHQTLTPSQIVLVVDGPIPNELEKVLSLYVRRFLYLEVFRLEINKGLANALHYGLTQCKFELIVRCDSDDYNYIDRFRILYNSIVSKGSSVAVVGSAINEVDSDSRLIVSVRTFLPAVKEYGILSRDPVAHPSVILRKSAVDSVGGYQGPVFFEDTYLWLRLLKNDYVICNLDEVLVDMMVNRAFFGRRSGLSYAASELAAFAVFRQEGLITFLSFCVGYFRSAFRLLPTRLVTKIYTCFLRR